MLLVFVLTRVSGADMLDYWQRHSIDSGNSGGPLRSVVFGDGQYVAVGGGGTIYTSPDGVSWTSRRPGGSPGSLNAVTFGNGIFVAVGHTSPVAGNIEAVNRLVLTSPDGVTWKRIDTGLTGSLNGVAYGNGIFVAVGSGGWVQTSTDGGSWNNARPSSDLLYGISFASDKFVAVGTRPSRVRAGWLNYYMMTSVNGRDWTAELFGELPEGSGSLSSVAFGKGTVVAVGSRHILTSTSGGSWTVRDAPVYGLSSVAYGNNAFVSVGRAGKIVTSADGSIWAERNSGISAHLSGVSYGGNGFVAVGLSGAPILHCADRYILSLEADQSSGGTGRLFGAGVHAAGLHVGFSAVPDANSTLVSWGGDCASFGQLASGTILMDGPKSCTALFGLNQAVDHPVKKGNASYIRLQEAFDNVAAGDEAILHMSGAYAGNAEYLAPYASTLRGGHDAGFSYVAGSFTTIKGILSVRGGALTIDNFAIQ